jgi:hypothetical protein
MSSNWSNMFRMASNRSADIIVASRKSMDISMASNRSLEVRTAANTSAGCQDRFLHVFQGQDHLKHPPQGSHEPIINLAFST